MGMWRGVDLLFSVGTEAGVREADEDGIVWDTRLCFPLTSVHAIKAHLEKNKKNLKYLVVIISSIWRQSYGH